jgi:hypothetical protein
VIDFANCSPYNARMRKKDFRVKSFFKIGFSFFFLFLSSISFSTEINENTLEIKEGLVGIIGYGTLMSLQSMEQTLGHKYEGPIYQVHLKDYIRGWEYRRPNNDPQSDATEAFKIDAYFLQNNKKIHFSGTVNLNIYSKNNSKINCMLYLITNEDLPRIDKRERGYTRVDVTDKIDEYLVTRGQIYVYEGFPEHPNTSSSEPEKYIIIKEYVDQVIRVCDGIGKNFRIEFDKSTRPPIYPIVSFEKIVWEKSDN